MKIKQFIRNFSILLLCCGVVQVAAQTPQYAFTYGTGGNAIPLGTGTSWDNYRAQFLYLPGYWTPTNVPSGGLITKIYFRVSSGATATTYNNFKVSIGNTSLTSLTTTYITTGLTLAVNASTKSFAGMSSNQWMEIALTTPVSVDLTMPLVIDVSQTGKVGGVGGYSLLAGTPPHSGNTQTYGSNPSSTTGSARNYSYQFGFDIVTCSTSVTQNPVSKTVCEKQNATFSIAAQDADGYKWQVDEGSGFVDIANGANYSGAASSTLNVNNIPFNFNGNLYRCIASKGTSTTCLDTSSAVTLTVDGLVKLDALKAKDTTCINAIKELAVKGSGSITTYKWQMLIPGQGYIDVPNQSPYVLMGDKMMINGVPDTLDGTRFRCVVGGICDSAISSETLLTVSLVPKVAIPPADVNTTPGNFAIFEVQASAAGARYQWQVAAPETFVNINDGGIYSGTRSNKLTVTGLSRVQDGFKFRCVVRSGPECNAPGDTSEFAVLYVAPTASVGGLENDNLVVLYPNPTGINELYIKTNTSLSGQELKYKVVDKTGRTVMVGSMTGNDKTRVDVARLASDIYMIEIVDATNNTVAKSRFTKL